MIASVGNEQTALLMLTVEAEFGAGPVTLPAARLYLLDEDEKIKAEQMIFFAAPADAPTGRGGMAPPRLVSRMRAAK